MVIYLLFQILKFKFINLCSLSYFIYYFRVKIVRYYYKKPSISINRVFDDVFMKIITWTNDFFMLLMVYRR